MRSHLCSQDRTFTQIPSSVPCLNQQIPSSKILVFIFLFDSERSKKKKKKKKKRDEANVKNAKKKRNSSVRYASLTYRCKLRYSTEIIFYRFGVHRFAGYIRSQTEMRKTQLYHTYLRVTTIKMLQVHLRYIYNVRKLIKLE